MEVTETLSSINNGQYCTFDFSSFTISNHCPLLYHTPNNKQPGTTTDMASLYTQFGRLNPNTIEAYRSYGAAPHSVAERRNFYLLYLQDVLPLNVMPVHIPNHLQIFTLSHWRDGREEIRLMYEGRIFMTCVVSMDTHPVRPEEIAGSLAFHHWRQGYFMRDHHTAWRTITALDKIRFCSSRDGREWERTATLHPMRDVEEVVAYFWQELERVRRQ